MLATIETYLPSSAEKVWEALLRRDTFLYVTSGMLGFRGRERWPDVFHQGMEIETRLVFWHLIPGWKHTLRIVWVDKESKELVSEESGGPVQKWNHGIRLEREAAQKCNYITSDMPHIIVRGELLERDDRWLHFRADVRGPEGLRLARSKATHWIIDDSQD